MFSPHEKRGCRADETYAPNEMNGLKLTALNYISLWPEQMSCCDAQKIRCDSRKCSGYRTGREADDCSLTQSDALNHQIVDTISEKSKPFDDKACIARLENCVKVVLFPRYRYVQKLIFTAMGSSINPHALRESSFTH